MTPRSTTASRSTSSAASSVPTAEYRWLINSGVPRYDERGQFAGYVGSALDITDRKEVEEANRDLAGRLIHAQEAERTRIARDLHDDLSQQLAGIAIMLSGLKRRLAGPSADADIDLTVSTLQERTATLAEAVRNLSHELHPSVLNRPASRRRSGGCATTSSGIISFR